MARDIFISLIPFNEPFHSWMALNASALYVYFEIDEKKSMPIASTVLYLSPPRSSAVMLMLLWATSASANTHDLETSTFSFSGFGTVGLVHSSEG